MTSEESCINPRVVIYQIFTFDVTFDELTINHGYIYGMEGLVEFRHVEGDYSETTHTLRPQKRFKSA